MNQILKSSLFKSINVFHLFSIKSSSNLKPQKNKSSFATIFNKEQTDFFTSQQISLSRTVFMEQVHGNQVVSCDQDCAGHWIPGVDGLVTTEKDLFLCVNTADCVPLFFFEPKNKIIGIAHAGWKGTLGQIGKKVISRIIKKHGGKKENILVGIGPAICGKCYQVDKERYDLFSPFHSGKARKTKVNKYYLDLKAINVKILIDTGIKPENIGISPYCTVCNNDLFFSYRNKETGEMISVISNLS